MGQYLAEISQIIVYIRKLIPWEESASVFLVFLNGPNSEVFHIIGRAECMRCPWLLAQTKVATILVRAECVRCPWLLAQTKVATIFDIFPHVGVVGVVLTLLPFTPEGIVVGF